MKVKQGSRTIENAVLLTLAGGYLDAYTYSVRGGVFANAQTGNIIKLGIHMINGTLQSCMGYLIPIIAFILGVIVHLSTERWMEKRDIHYIRRTALFFEIITLLIVSRIPVQEELNWIANALVSFACAIQMEAFPVFANQPIATTVGTGNLRKAVDFTFRAIADHDSGKMKTAGIYIMIVLIFILGVVIGTVISDRIGVNSVLIPAGLLILAQAVITIRTEHHKK